MPTDHILDRPDDWTQTFWGNVGVRLAGLLPYSPVSGSRSEGIVAWNNLIEEAIDGFELGCALSLQDPSLGKSVLERDSTNIDPFWGKTPENWESVYEPVIQDLQKRISMCGSDGPSYGNLFPESGPDLTQAAASKVIARQTFRGLILPFISEDVAEQILVSGTKERAREMAFLTSMPISELLTTVKQNAELVYKQWAEPAETDSSETNSVEIEGVPNRIPYDAARLHKQFPQTNSVGIEGAPNRIPYFAIIVLWSYSPGCDPSGVDDWSDERWYATEKEALETFEAMLIRARDPGYDGKPFAGLSVEYRDKNGWHWVRSRAFPGRCKCSAHRGPLTNEEVETLAFVDNHTIQYIQRQKRQGLKDIYGPSSIRWLRLTDIYDEVFVRESRMGASSEKPHSAGIEAANEFLGPSITGEDGL